MINMVMLLLTQIQAVLVVTLILNKMVLNFTYTQVVIILLVVPILILVVLAILLIFLNNFLVA